MHIIYIFLSIYTTGNIKTRIQKRKYYLCCTNDLELRLIRHNSLVVGITFEKSSRKLDERDSRPGATWFCVLQFLFPSLFSLTNFLFLSSHVCGAESRFTRTRELLPSTREDLHKIHTIAYV